MWVLKAIVFAFLEMKSKSRHPIFSSVFVKRYAYELGHHCGRDDEKDKMSKIAILKNIRLQPVPLSIQLEALLNWSGLIFKL